MQNISNTHNKVFCKDCKFWQKGAMWNGGYRPGYCYNPKFIVTTYDPVEGEYLQFYNSEHPDFPNRNCSCNGYKPYNLNQKLKRKYLWSKIYLILLIIFLLILYFA